MNADHEIAPFLRELEVLGASPADDGTPYAGATWIRCFVEFASLPGEDVIDIPVLRDLPEGTKSAFGDKCLHVSRLDADQMRSAIAEKLSQIRGRDKASVFAQLDEIGFSNTIPKGC